MLGFELKAVWIKMIIIIRYDRVALEKDPLRYVWYDKCCL